MSNSSLEQTILDCLEQNEAVVLATVVSQVGSTPRTAGTQMLIRRDGPIFGTIGGGLVEATAMQAAREVFGDGQTRNLDFDLSKTDLTKNMDLICGGKTRVRVERILPEDTMLTAYREKARKVREARKILYLFGAGHVAMETARLAAAVDFRIAVLDDREDFANPERFPEAEIIRVPASFDQALEGLSIDTDSYVLIMTRGHSHDRTVLTRILGTPAGYIGMIGSRSKRKTIFASLLEEGFTQSDLDRIFSPVGLPIKAQTPAEIGVSIVAQLIAERARKARSA